VQHTSEVKKRVRLCTFDAGLPDGVGVPKARDNVVGDGEGEHEPVDTAFLERKPWLLAGPGLHKQSQDDVWAPGRQDGEARDLHVRLQRLCPFGVQHTVSLTGKLGSTFLSIQVCKDEIESVYFIQRT
jgi:hypothetical protein